jgi:hypothetical protein
MTAYPSLRSWATVAGVPDTRVSPGWDSLRIPMIKASSVHVGSGAQIFAG